MLTLEKIWHEVRISKLEKRLAAERRLRGSLPDSSTLKSIANRNVSTMETKLIQMRNEWPMMWLFEPPLGATICSASRFDQSTPSR